MKHFLNIMATWRLMELLRDEDAPYDVLKNVRLYIQSNAASYANITSFERFLYEVGSALRCNWCLSIWCGLFVALATRQNIVYALAYSAGALFITQFREADPLDTWQRWIREMERELNGTR